MTTSTAQSPSASLATGATSSQSASSSKPGVVVFAEFNASRPLPVKDAVSLEQLIDRYQADPQKARKMAVARSTVAESLYRNVVSLCTLRLKAGLSQAQLAAQALTSQPHLSRIELGQNDPSTDLIERIAKALSLDASEVFRAIRVQRAASENRS